MMAKKDDEAEMKQRGLDISNRAREAGTEKTGFFQRLREGNIDDPNSAAYKKYGAGRARLDDQIETGRLKLADEVQKKVKDDADFAAEDARSKTARAVAGKPAAKTTPAAKPKSGIVTKEELAKSGLSLRDYMNKQQGKTRRDGTAPSKSKSASEYSNATDAMRNNSRMAAANQKSSTTDALRAKSRKEAAFEAAKRMAKTSEGQAQRKAQEKGQALERVTPEEYIVGGGAGLGLKTLNQMAKNLAKPKIKEYNPITLPAPKAAPKVDTKALPAPTKRLEYDKKGALEARREAKDVRLKNEVAEENAARYGLNPRAPGYESAAKAVRKEMGEKDFSFKKGGSVRGAGIAQRGVRKCKMV
jgi:hypothetical protein